MHLLEAQDFEAIPLTDDSVVDNIESLQTCNLVIVDDSAPSWVLRETVDRHLMAASYLSTPIDFDVVAFVDDESKFVDFIAMVRPFLGPLKPVDADLIERIALVKALYPLRRTDACLTTSMSF